MRMNNRGDVFGEGKKKKRKKKFKKEKKRIGGT
jgi:hypothetical protein